MEPAAFVFQTAFCWVGLSYTGRGLGRLELSRLGPEEVQRRLVARIGDGVVCDEPAPGSTPGELRNKLNSYFAGERVDFDEPVDLDALTPFQRRVLAVTRQIPYGEVRSYAWVADNVGSPLSFRAVGQALARNPVGIVIPCHRVVTSRGTLGGFGWGVDVKKSLLSLEGADIRCD